MPESKPSQITFRYKISSNYAVYSIYSVIDDLDYSLEEKIFSGPIGELPPIYEGYFIDIQVANLSGRDINDIIPADCEIGYSRDNIDA